MRVSEIRVKRIRVNQGLGVQSSNDFEKLAHLKHLYVLLTLAAVTGSRQQCGTQSHSF